MEINKQILDHYFANNMKKYQKVTIVDRVLKKLFNLGVYITYKAQTGSVYLKFKDERLRSLRIGDHDGKEKYRFKWNLRKDIKQSYLDKDRGVTRFYYSFEDLDYFVDRINKYYQTILKNGIN